MSKKPDDLPTKLNLALSGHDLDDVIIVLMAALGVAIHGQGDDRVSRCKLVEEVTSYLLDKAGS